MLYTVTALLAFAANSVFCRMALGNPAIDAASFTTLRLFSGALVLSLLMVVAKNAKTGHRKGTWISAIMLFVYAAAFSFAYLSLSTGTGALILFGFVQITMIIGALHSGEKPVFKEWFGLFLAIAGLVYLVSPGLTAPSVSGSGLMAISGIAWGIYSLRGRDTEAPLVDTTGNFIRSLPFVFVVSFLFIGKLNLSTGGILLAFASGAVASGMGYVIWYAALKGLTVTRAATVQLMVPVLATIGGVIFLSEKISLRLIVATIVILGGITIAVTSRQRNWNS